MIQLILFIIILLAIAGGVLYYINYRSHILEEEKFKDIKDRDNFRKNSFQHISNTLKEIDHLNTTYNTLGSNTKSLCYDKNKKIIKDCKCHPSCKTCGYSDKPIGMNQCLKCKNNTSVNQLYSNGAGWCGSFGPGGEPVSKNRTRSSGFAFKNNEASVTQSDRDTISYSNNRANTDTEEISCEERARRMCPMASTKKDWEECLALNKQSLILAGCNMQLEGDEDSSATASAASAASAASSNAASSNAASSTAASSTAASSTAAASSSSSSPSSPAPPPPPPTPWRHNIPIYGKHRLKCPVEYPYPMVKGQTGSGKHVACSKKDFSDASRDNFDNSCAMKGFISDRGSTKIKKRCYPDDQTIIINGKTMKCPDSTAKSVYNVGNGYNINKHVFNIRGAKKCYTFNTSTQKYGPPLEDLIEDS